MLKQKIATVIAICWSLFQLFAVFYPSVFHITAHRAIHLCFALVLCALLFGDLLRSQTRLAKWMNGAFILAFIAGSLALTYHMLSNAERFEVRPYGMTTMDSVISVLGLILILEGTRRIIGWSLVLVAAFFILYGMYGDLIPGALGHGGGTFLDVSERLFYSADGVYGQILGISATIIFIYLLFGGFLLTLGGGEFFTDLSSALVGSTRGGAAKVAVLASAFFGSISGSAISNVVTTGTVTIPMMKRLGFKPEFAGAVEAVASSGGQILPPVMGATAFVLANMMGVSYMEVLVAAAVPAILYFVSLLFMVDFEAAKTGIKGIDKKDLPDVRDVMRRGWHFFVPFIVLIYLLLFIRWEAQKAGIYAIGSMVVMELIRRPSLETIKKLVEGLAVGARTAISVAIPCATIGIVVGIVLSTGLGLSFTTIVRSFAGDSTLSLLLIMMVGSLVIGMGVPTTAAYVMLAVLMVPVLIDGGVVPMAAHMFALYFGILSVVTPPVALAAYAAASISKGNPTVTGFIAFRLALAGFIIPFMFVYQPGLLMIGSTQEILLAVCSGFAGVICLGGVMQNYFFGRIHWGVRGILAIACIVLVTPEYDLVGFVLFVAVAILQIVKHRSARATEKLMAQG